MSYDSTADTLLHIRRVQHLLTLAAQVLLQRGLVHDASKLVDPEKATFDEFTPKLKDLVYGSPEYKACTDAMDPAIQHHYAANSHHPQFYENGVDGMDLFDLLEMLLDWKAAGERHADGGDIFRSIEINRERFKLSDQTVALLRNTAERYVTQEAWRPS